MSIDLISEKLEQEQVKFQLGVPLAKFTTWKVGGPADILIEAKDTETLIKVSKIANQLDVKLTILGWGSNVLISDNGIRGLVVINRSQEVTLLDESPSETTEKVDKVQPRLEQVDVEKYYSASELEYDETDSPITTIIADSGVYLPFLINHLLGKGITGLQWFAGIPATLGGAIYNNIHGGNHFISEYVASVETLTSDGNIKKYNAKELEFDYDYSIFHKNEDIILRVTLNLYKGDVKRARQTSIEWATKKKIQPSNSAGCCFQNISTEEQARLGLDSNSWGYIIDKILNLKNTRIGGAKISPYHAAFIETDKTAKASDILQLFELIYNSSQKKLGITPKPEIFFLGFEQQEIARFT